MQKIYLIAPIFILSLLLTGCSSGSSSDTPATESNQTEDENTTTACQDGEIFSEDLNQCVQEIDSEQNPDNGNEQNQNNDENKSESNDTKIPTCGIGEVLDDKNICQKDENVKYHSNGTVRDGLISGASITACKIVDGNKSELNSTCSDTDENGQFQCVIYENDFEYIVFKATGGTDLGESSDAKDDKTNEDILKTIIVKEDVENNKSAFVTPATNLIVLNAYQNNWNVSDAITTVTKALNTNSEDIFDAKNGVQSATIVANILDTVGSDKNRTEIYIALAKEESIYSGEAITTGLLTKLDDRISAETEAVLSQQIIKSVKTPSAENEKVIDILSTRVENEKAISEVIVNNFVNVIENDFNIKSTILDLVAEIPTEKTAEDLKTTTDKISEILSGVQSQSDAIDLLKTKLVADENIQDLTVEDVKAEIGEIICGENQKLVGTTCEDIPEVEPVIKDAVNSPSDIPAIPSTKAEVFNPSTFPSIPSNNDYAQVEDDNLTQLSNQTDTRPDFENTSGEINNTTPY